jgi:hypothetical protein
MRTIRATVTFRRPFSLGGFDGEQPAGSYSIETDEVLSAGAFPNYLRTETRMRREYVADGLHGAPSTAVVDPRQLRAALAVDAAHTQAYDAFVAWRALYAPRGPDSER